VTPFAVVVASGILMLPAVWNGYPLFFFDTLDYLKMAESGQLIAGRTLPYGLFVALTDGGRTLWPTAFVQCLIVSWVLYEALVVFSPLPASRVLAPTALLLTLLTSLPWYAGQIMPDVFAGVVALAAVTLALSPDRLPAGRRVVLTLIAAAGAALHASYLPFIFGLAIVAAAFRLARPLWPDLRCDVRLPLAAALGTVILVLTAHWFVAGRLIISQSGSVYLFARLVQDGIAQQWLDDNCPRQPELRLCAVRPRLKGTANDFLWNPYWGGDSPFLELGGWEGLRDEAGRVVRGSLVAYPGWNLSAAVQHTLRQLTMVATGDGMEPFRWLYQDEMPKLMPAETADLLAARQQREPKPGIDFAPLNRIHVPLARATEMLAPLLVIAALWRRDQRLAALATGVTLALLGNAFITGSLANPFDRYQSRIVWIALFLTIVAALRLTLPARWRQ
jgi:hypothetical protein